MAALLQGRRRHSLGDAQKSDADAVERAVSRIVDSASCKTAHRMAAQLREESWHRLQRVGGGVSLAWPKIADVRLQAAAKRSHNSFTTTNQPVVCDCSWRCCVSRGGCSWLFVTVLRRRVIVGGCSWLFVTVRDGAASLAVAARGCS